MIRDDSFLMTFMALDRYVWLQTTDKATELL